MSKKKASYMKKEKFNIKELLMKFVKKLIPLGVLTISTIIIGFILIVLSYGFNSELDYSGDIFKETQKTMKAESKYPNVTKYDNSKLDNYTDSLMILTAMHPINEEDTVIQSAMKNPRANGNPKDTIGGELKEYEDETYSRYWHGYLVFLKPLLKVFNYKQIRILNGFVQGGLLFILIALLIKKNYKFLIIPFLCAYAIISPLTVAVSIQYSAVWYIVLISIIMYLLLQEKIVKHNYHYLFFALVGMVTSYFDLLTYPVATLGMLLIVVISTEKLNFVQAIKRVLICGFSWVFGYSIMWIAKIIIAMIILPDMNVFEDAKEAFSIRSAEATTKGEEITSNVLFTRLFKTFAPKIKRSDDFSTKLKAVFDNSIIRNTFMIVGITGFLSIIWSIVKNKVSAIKNKLSSKNDDNDEIDDLLYLSLIDKDIIRIVLNVLLKAGVVLGLSLISIVWYKCTTQHSYVHTFMTYRTLVVLFFAIFTFLFKIGYDLNRALKYNNKK